MARTTVRRRENPLPASGVATDVVAFERGFATVYGAHHRDVYRYVLALTGSHPDAEDITAETFARAYRSCGTGSPSAERVLPWLLLTERRLATDRWRRLRRVFAVAVPGRDRDQASHERTESWLWFEALAAALPARQREVLILRYQRDLSDPDIASIMGLSESGVRSLVARALESLRANPELLG